MTNTPVRTLGLAVVIGCMAISAQAANLFSPVDPTTANKARVQDKTYQMLSQQPGATILQVVKANPDAVGVKVAALTLNLGPGLNLPVRRLEAHVTPSRSQVWSGVIASRSKGKLKFDPLDTVMIVKNGAWITGDVLYQGHLYQIRPLKSGAHAIVARNYRQMPPEHPPSFNNAPVIEMPVTEAPSGPNKATAGAPPTITVMVNYTPAVAASTADVNGLIDLAVAETNQGYANSGVGINMQLVSKSQVSYTESGSFDTDLANYRGTSDGYMDAIHSTRSSVYADVAVLLINDHAYCGLASGIGSNPSTAFAAVDWSCATGYYSFGHEIGHLQSARHDPANDSTTTPYAYGHGYQYNGSPKWRTIMAYDCPGGCPRLDYWSNPNKLYNGVPMGTTSTNNNARVLNATRWTVAGFQSNSCIPDGGVDDTLGQTTCCSSYAVNNSTYCSVASDWGNSWASCNHICGTAPVNGCIPSGGIDDTLGSTSCCSGQAVSGSTWCLDPDDYGTDWTTCVQTCQ